MWRAGLASITSSSVQFRSRRIDVIVAASTHKRLTSVWTTSFQVCFLSSQPAEKTSPHYPLDSFLSPQEKHDRFVEQSAAVNNEKRQRHEERMAKQVVASGLRNGRSLRSHAAKAIPYLLGTNTNCFELTMAALNLNQSFSLSYSEKDSSRTTRGDSGGGVLAEARQLYLDSIPSFARLLIEDPSSVDRYFKSIEIANGELESSSKSASTVDSKSDGEPELTRTEKLLEELVRAGFSDLRFAKHHRKMKEYEANFDKYVDRVKKKMNQYSKRKLRLQNLKGELAEWERKYALEIQQLKGSAVDSKMAAKETNEANGVDKASLLSTALGTVMKAFDFSSKTLDPPALEISNVVDDVSTMQKVRRRWKTLRSLVKEAEQSLTSTSDQLKRLKAERDSFAPLLTKEQYEDASMIMMEVLKELSPAFAAHIHERHTHMIEQYRTLDAKTDLTKPETWYMRARLDRRKIIFHGGPTNSGKTYTALQRLKEAEKGLYLSPLRLLAAEVYEKLTAQGIYTNLFTGQEKREIPFATHSAATVEMAPTGEDFDIVVIDEIQMMSDPFRGFAWTRALLGLRCKEIHVCGGIEACDLVKKITDFCGDDFLLKRYERFSGLTVSANSFAKGSEEPGSYRMVQPGDAVVAFSRNDIFAIKREIESTTPHKCSVIYGSLPPETRTDQARRFNDPNSGFDVLVASDAIGMGLNLNIRRIVFNSMFKNNGESAVQLDHSSVKQISGRAGRRNSPFPVGEVTCRDPEDMEHLRRCMSTDIPPIQKAGLLPTAAHIELFSEAIKKYNLDWDSDDLHRILRQFSEMATLKGDFFLCRQTPMNSIAKSLNDLNLSISDKYVLCMSPVQTGCHRSMKTLKNFAYKHSLGEASGLNRKMIPKPARTFQELSQLCSIHSELELFLWLHNKFPGNLVEQQAALAAKSEAISLINKGLAEAEHLRLDHDYLKRDRNLRESWKKSQGEAERDFVHDSVHRIDEFDDFLPHSELDEI